MANTSTKLKAIRGNKRPSKVIAHPTKKLWKHQAQTKELYERSTIVYDLSDPGCVSADTEFLSPTGWKRIDKYNGTDLVAQFLPNTKEIEFVKPLDYIKRPCDSMIHIKPVRNMSQQLSGEHRVLLFNEDGSWYEKSAIEFFEAHEHSSRTRRGQKFCNTFKVHSFSSIALTTEEIRVMVAVIADGHFPTPSSSRCTIRLKKQHKVKRLIALLQQANIEYLQKQCGGQPDFQVFRFNAPLHHKEFIEYWWDCSQEQLETVADEVPYWDGSFDKRTSNSFSFSSVSKQSAEFVQYACAAAGYNTSCKRQQHRQVNNRIYKPDYVVTAFKTKTGLIGAGRKESVTIQPNPEGYKYCFSVQSTFLLLRHNGYIFASGNTGKTRAHLEAFAERRRKGGGKALVVAPKSLLETAWLADAWEYVKDMRCSVSYASNRANSFSVDADVYIVNTDGVKWLKANVKPKFFDDFDTLIIDEISYFKHHTSQRSKAAKWLSKYFTYRSGLTGTPNPKSVTELWHQVFLLDQGERLGQSFYQFRSATQVARQVGPSAQHVKWEDKPGAEMAAFGLLADISIRHLFEECMDIPPNVERHIGFDLSPKLAKQYRQLEAATVLQLRDERVVAVNAAVLRNKLLQLASGAVYTGDSEYTVLDNTRYELITELVAEHEHSIVFYNWIHQKEQLLNLANKHGIECEYLDSTVKDRRKVEIVNEYQAGNLQAIYLHPATGAHGLTLTRGTRTIWSSPIYQPDFLKQGKHRIYRGGQTKKTETIMIEARNTVEKKVFEILNRDNQKMQDFLEVVHAAKETYDV